VLTISGGEPSFRDDDGSVSPGVTEALARYSAGEGSENAALSALASSRLLVPVVAVLSEQLDGGAGEGSGADQGSGAGDSGSAGYRGGGEKSSEMAMPTLIGMDGRRAMPAFTCLDSMRRWQPDARPVPVTATAVWQAAVADSCAVVVDVAGPVPIAVEGARLAALARGEPAPLPFTDPDVHEIVADVLAAQLDVSAFELLPGEAGPDLTILLTWSSDRADDAANRLAADVGHAVMARLGVRLRRGVAIRIDREDGRS